MSTDTNIEQEINENRQSRRLQHGPGVALEKQVNSRADIKDTEASEKFYKRKGTGTLGGFNQMQMFRDGVDLQTRDDGSYVVPNQYMLPGKKSLFGIDPGNGRRITDISKTGSPWVAPLRMVAGSFHDMAKGTAELGLDVAEGMGAKLPQARANIEAYQDPKWLQESSGAIEDLGRTLGQFMWGFGSAGKGLVKAGMKQSLKKDMVASVAAGQTFDPAEGNLFTLLNESDMLPETMRYLDSMMTTEEMGEYHGRMALVLEEVAMGGGITAVSKMLSTIRKSYKGYGDEMIKNGVMQYHNASGSLNHPTLGAKGTEVLSENHAMAGITSIAHGMQINNVGSGVFMKYAAEGGIDESLAAKAWNQASKNKLNRVSEFMNAQEQP